MSHIVHSLITTKVIHMLVAVPKDPQPERVIIPISRELLDRIEEFRWAHRAPSRAEAMRALLEQGLANQESAARRIER
jgi:metal-responsive CopG/Arc/MetJ family transcriptional regulator